MTLLTPDRLRLWLRELAERIALHGPAGAARDRGAFVAAVREERELARRLAVVGRDGSRRLVRIDGPHTRGGA